jgi:hypothetical protein
MTLYACAASSWLGADVLDTARTDPATGHALVIPSHGRMSRDTSTMALEAANELRIRSGTIWDTLLHIERARYRGGLSRPLEHAPQWLRSIVRCEYHPQALAAIAGQCQACVGSVQADGQGPAPSGAVIPRSRKTIMKHLAETFDLMVEICVEYAGADGAWPELGVNYPPSFWESPISRRARAFIDASFNFFVYEDIDPLWRRFASQWSDSYVAPSQV